MNPPAPWPRLTPLLITFLSISLTAQERFEQRNLKTEHPPLPGDVLVPLDIDNDGDQDLLTGGALPPYAQLYLNDGAGNLTEVTATHLAATGGNEIRSAIPGDFDGDGTDDLVLLVNFAPPYFWAFSPVLLVNDGTGHFANVTAGSGLSATHGVVHWITSGDIDGDGDLDIAAAIGDPFGVGTPDVELLFVNDGSGRFSEVSGTQLPANTSTNGWSVVLADLDGDGDLDLTFSDEPSPQSPIATRVYENDGTGDFVLATTIQLPATPCLVEYPLDVDGDGDVDLLVGEGVTGLLRNDGSGTFTFDSAMPVIRAASLYTPQAASWGVQRPAFFDIDADQDLDIAVGTQLLVQHGGAFTDESEARGLHAASGSAACAVDWDDDGDFDLMLGGGVRYQNDGTGYFGATWVPRAPRVRSGGLSIAWADLDGNGERDLIATNSILMQRHGSFVDEVATRFPGFGFQHWIDVVVGDFDSDGDVDLAGCSYTSTGGTAPVLALNDGTGTFTPSSIPAPIASTRAGRVGAADLDGDGDLDLVLAGVAPNYGSTVIYSNDGTATFTDVTAVALANPQHSSCFAHGDIDGDGDVDLVLGRYGTNGVLENNGTGWFLDVTAASVPGTSDSTTSIALVDVDSDGDLDVFVGNVGRDRLLLNDGTGSFTEVTATHVPTANLRTNDVAAADIDADGDLDLVLAGEAPGQRVLANDGVGRFTDATVMSLVPSGHRTNAVALVDLDDDGDVDLALGHGGPQPTFGGICCPSFDIDVRVLTNLSVQFEIPQLAVPGRAVDFTVLTRGRGSVGADAALLGLSTVSARIPIPGLGLLGIDPNQLLFTGAFAVPRAAGEGSLSLYVPNAPGLAGIDFYSQAVVIGQGNRPRLTNRLRDRVFP